MKGYWLILGTDVTDQAAQAEYTRLWAPIAEKYHARLNPTSVPPVLKEARETTRVIVVEFPSYEIAKACYEDPAYQEAKGYALKAYGRDLIMFEGDIAQARSGGPLRPPALTSSRRSRRSSRSAG